MDTSKSQQSSLNLTKDIKDYITQLSSQEKKVLEIAKEHLKSSFNIEKSIGYLEWKNKQ